MPKRRIRACADCRFVEWRDDCPHELGLCTHPKMDEPRPRALQAVGVFKSEVWDCPCWEKAKP